MKFDMSRAWNEAVAMIGGNREVLTIVAGLFFFVPAVITTMVVPEMPQPPAGADPQQVFERLGETMAATYAQYWWLFLLATIVQGIGTIALLALLRDSARPTVGEAIRTGATGFLPYILASILIGFAVVLVALVLVGLPSLVTPALGVLGALLALLVIVYMMVKFSLVGPVIAIEKIFNPAAALKRSWGLTKGNSLRLFGFYLLLFIVYMVIAAIVTAVLGLLVAGLGMGTVSQVVQGLISGLLGAVVTVVFVSVLAAVHRQLAGPSAENLGETFD